MECHGYIAAPCFLLGKWRILYAGHRRGSDRARPAKVTICGLYDTNDQQTKLPVVSQVWLFYAWYLGLECALLSKTS
jgi:hypothetical protein